MVGERARSKRSHAFRYSEFKTKRSYTVDQLELIATGGISNMNARSTRKRGQSIIETVVGIMFLVPIVLFLFDIAVLVLCNTANDNLAKSTCRAAASATNASGVGDANSAFTSATQVADSFNSSAIIGKAGSSFLTGFSYNANGSAASAGGTWPGPITTGAGNPPTPATGQVACITTMQVTLPVPFPFLPSKWDFQSKDVEPIVSIAP